MTVGGFDRFEVSDGTQIEVTNATDGRTTFMASERGTGGDNPTSPSELTPLQLSRSVTLYFSETTGFNLTLGVISGGSGRNFMISGTTPFPTEHCPPPPAP